MSLDNFNLVKRGDLNESHYHSDCERPTNVEGHYPRFMLPGAINLLGEDTREMSVILESFLPQLQEIGIELNETNNLIKEIVLSTEIFRRLKGISQIELLPFAFKQVPWFTRYTHSCLTYAIGDHVINKLSSEINLTRVESEAAKLAFLIHDIGHGPFSHLTERAFKTPKGIHGKIPKEYDHEFWTKILLNELQERLFTTYNNPYLKDSKTHSSNKNLKKSDEYNLEIFYTALSMLSKNHNFVVTQLVSGQIDIDRLSNYLGDRVVVSSILESDKDGLNEIVNHLSSYEETVQNVKSMLNNFIILEKDESGKKCGKYLGLKEEAVDSVIHFFFDRHIIRYHLLKHYRREASNNLLQKILLRAQELVRDKELDKLGKTDLLIITWLYGNHTEAEFIELDDQLVFNQIKKWARHSEDPILKDLTLRFTAQCFFTSYSCEQDGKQKKPTEELIEKIKAKVTENVSIDIPKKSIEEYYFSYEETTSKPYHVDRDEVMILTNSGKIKKLSSYIEENNHELGKILLKTRFERYSFIVPPEVEF